MNPPLGISQTTRAICPGQLLEDPVMGIHQAQKVLVVEDNPLVARVMEEVLARMGLSVAIHHKLDDALITAELGNFDLALVDMHLGGQLAYPLVLKLQGSGKPFAVVTSFEQPELKADFPNLVIAMKPLGVKALESVVLQLLVEAEMGSLPVAALSELPR